MFQLELMFPRQPCTEDFMKCITEVISQTKIAKRDRKEYSGVKVTFDMISIIGRTSYSAMKANFYSH